WLTPANAPPMLGGLEALPPCARSPWDRARFSGDRGSWVETRRTATRRVSSGEPGGGSIDGRAHGFEGRGERDARIRRTKAQSVRNGERFTAPSTLGAG